MSRAAFYLDGRPLLSIEGGKVVWSDDADLPADPSRVTRNAEANVDWALAAIVHELIRRRARVAALEARPD